MFENLGAVKEKFSELEKKISDPEIINNNEHWKKLMNEHADLSPVVK